MAKNGQVFKKYSPEFKISVILDMREHCLTYHETMRKYFPQKKEKDYSFLKKWERKYLEEGIEGLAKENRGDHREYSSPLKSKEDLIAENQRLRMENDCLKKLNALVQKRIERERKKK